MPTNRVARLVKEEKRKDEAHTPEIAGALHHVEVVRLHLLYLMLALKDRIGRDVEAFASAFPERRVSLRKCDSDDGSIRVDYLFDPADGRLAPRVLELVPDNEQGFAVHEKENQGQAFGGVEQLFEYLLVPLFTGHSR